LERRVLEEEEEDVALRVRGEPLLLLLLVLHPPPLRLQELLRVDERLHVVLASKARDLLGRTLVVLLGRRRSAALDERRVRIDEVVEAEARVDELLDALDAPALHVP